ncbi:MAG: outer membrane protein assembly factor BamD [Deltaproteobacteria bacterium]
MRQKYLGIIAVLAVILPLTAGFCQEDKKIFNRGVDYVAEGDINAAFMTFHTLVSSYPGSSYTEQAMFAMGEYYYGVGDYRDATNAFWGLLNQFPDSDSKVFCLAYLLEMARKEKKPTVQSFEQALSDSQRLIFLFKDSKELKYGSIFSKAYKAVYHIDKLEIFVDDTLFTSVAY